MATELTWEQRQRLKVLVGQPVASLEGEDRAMINRLIVDGRAAVNEGTVARIPVAYGDGKKSPYGVTYADEIIGEFA